MRLPCVPTALGIEATAARKLERLGFRAMVWASLTRECVMLNMAARTSIKSEIDRLSPGS